MNRSAIIIAHGSEQDSEESAAYLQSKRVEAHLGIRVDHAFRDCDEETMRAKLSRLAIGSDEIVVVPLFFASSAFSEKLVPRMVGLEEGARSGVLDIDGRRVRVKVGRPFGDDPLMCGVIGSVLAREGAEAGRTAVMLIGHGSADGMNSRAVEFNAGLVREYGFEAFPCYNEMCGPTVEEALDDVLTRGYRDILAIPLFVSASHHSSVEIPQKLGLPEGVRDMMMDTSNGGVRLRYAREIGMEPGIADILCHMIEH